MDRTVEYVTQSSPATQPISGTKVMIVEDEAVVALHLRQELTKLGHVVAGMATSGEQALRMIEDVFPDIVLMDIHIQGEMDGIETAKRIPRYLHATIKMALERSRADEAVRENEALLFRALCTTPIAEC